MRVKEGTVTLARGVRYAEKHRFGVAGEVGRAVVAYLASIGGGVGRGEDHFGVIAVEVGEEEALAVGAIAVDGIGHLLDAGSV